MRLDAALRPRVIGLRCRNCERPEATGPNFVCPACFGPLEIVYDRDAIRAQVSRERIAAREPGIWRYLELLPLDAVPARSLAVGSTPLLRADRLGAELGLAPGGLRLKDDTRNPTLSFKDRVVAIATARAVEFGFDTLACASTGNLAGATAAAAAAVGMRAVVFVPADLEPAKIDHALSYGATVVPVNGTYDEINRLSLEIADEEGWAFVNVNLRPYYSEGSKTMAFEVAEQLGWRLPDVIVAPIASGSLFTKVARGFEDLVAAGLVESKPVRFIGAQAAGCSPVATAFAEGVDEHDPGSEPGHHRSFARHWLAGRRPVRAGPCSPDGWFRRGHPRFRDRRRDPPARPIRGRLRGNRRRRHDRRAGAGRRPRPDPERRRGRRPDHGQRRQDARREVVRARRRR